MSTTTRVPCRPANDRIENVPPCTELGLPEPSPLTPDQIAKLARGLASPARVAILNQFRGGCSRTTGEIVGASGLAQSTVSEHLRFLRDAELLSARRDGSRVWYCMRRSVINLFMEALASLANDPNVADGASLVTGRQDEGPYR